jgi:hypothetical protein
VCEMLLILGLCSSSRSAFAAASLPAVISGGAGVAMEFNSGFRFLRYCGSWLITFPSFCPPSLLVLLVGLLFPLHTHKVDLVGNHRLFAPLLLDFPSCY